MTKDVWKSAPSSRWAKPSNYVLPSVPSGQWHVLHQTLGNQGVQRLLQARAIQAKLRVNQPNDPYEREADRIADQVTGMPAPQQSLQTTRIPGSDPQHLPLPPIVHEVLSSPGQPLDPATRSFVEPRLGHEFSQVRVHRDEKAAASTRAVGALAYTVGQNVVFGVDQYAPETMSGKRLLTHELVHVLQQNGGASPRIQRTPDLTTPSSAAAVPQTRILSAVEEIGRLVGSAVANLSMEDMALAMEHYVPELEFMIRNLEIEYTVLERRRGKFGVKSFEWARAIDFPSRFRDRDLFGAWYYHATRADAAIRRGDYKEGIDLLQMVERGIKYTADEISKYDEAFSKNVLQIASGIALVRDLAFITLDIISLGKAGPIKTLAMAAAQNIFIQSAEAHYGLGEGVDPVKAVNEALVSILSLKVGELVTVKLGRLGITAETFPKYLVQEVATNMSVAAVQLVGRNAAKAKTIGEFFEFTYRDFFDTNSTFEGMLVNYLGAMLTKQATAQQTKTAATTGKKRSKGKTAIKGVRAPEPQELSSKEMPSIPDVDAPPTPRIEAVGGQTTTPAPPTPVKASGRAWNDPALAADVALDLYKNAGVKKPLADNVVLDRFKQGYRFDPGTRRWSKPHKPRGSRAPRAPTEPFLRDALKKVSDPKHPLHGLVEVQPSTGGQKIAYGWRRTTRITESGKTQTGRYPGGETGPIVQAGHADAYASGAPQRYVLEDADLNQVGGQVIETKGALSFKVAVDVEGVPVDLGSLQQWERLLFVPSGTVAKATKL